MNKNKLIDQSAAVQIKQLVAPVLQALQRTPAGAKVDGISIHHCPTNVEIHINSNNQAEPKDQKSKKTRCLLPRMGQLSQFFESLDPEREQLLFDLFQSMPRPRWNNLQYCVFRACANKGMTVSEMADFMDMHANTAHMRLRSFGIKPGGKT